LIQTGHAPFYDSIFHLSNQAIKDSGGDRYINTARRRFDPSQSHRHQQ